MLPQLSKDERTLLGERIRRKVERRGNSLGEIVQAMQPYGGSVTVFDILKIFKVGQGLQFLPTIVFLYNELVEDLEGEVMRIVEGRKSAPKNVSRNRSRVICYRRSSPTGRKPR